MADQENSVVEVNPDEMEFTIPIEGLSYVETELEKLNKRAKRLKLEPMKLIKVGTRQDTISVKYNSYSHAGMEKDARGYVKIPVRLITLRIEGNPPKLPGYKLIARLDWKEGNPFIAEVPGQNTPVKYRSIDRGCDHCKKRVNRNDTFVLQNTQTQEYVQVGRSCLADFLGHDDKARDIVNSMQFFKTVRDWMESLKGVFADFGEDDPKDRMYGGVRHEPVWMMDEFLPLVVMLAQNNGYRSAAYAREKPGAMSTGEQAGRIIWDFQNARGPGAHQIRDEMGEILKRVTDQHRETAKKMIKKVIEVYEKDPDGASTYLYNIYNIAKDGMDQVLSEKKLGMAASIFQFYMKEMEREEKQRDKEKEREKAKDSDWVGKINERVELKLKISRPNYSFESMYGYMSIMFFVDENGNQFTWKTSSPFDGSPGDWFDIKATIKAHNEYKGIKQTELTRVKVVKEYPPGQERQNESVDATSMAYRIEKDGRKIIGWNGTGGVFEDPLTAKKAGQTDWGFYGKGIYFSNSESKARGYAKAGDGILIKARLDMTNPFIMDIRSSEKRSASAKKLKTMGARLDHHEYPKDKRNGALLTALLKKNGYDGMIIYGHGVDYVVFSPKQIEEISREKVTTQTHEGVISPSLCLTLKDLQILSSPYSLAVLYPKRRESC